MPDQTQQIVQIKSNQSIFHKGDSIKKIALIIKGKILIRDGSFSSYAQAGEILACYDIYEGKYMADYVAKSDGVLYMLSVQDEQSLEKFFESNSDYRGLFVQSMVENFCRYHEFRKKSLLILNESRSHIKDHYAFLRRLGYSFKDEPNITDDPIEEVYGFSEEPEESEYYEESLSVGAKAFQSFYKQSSFMAIFESEKLHTMAKDMRDDAISASESLKEIYLMFVNATDNALLKREMEALEAQYERGEVNQSLVTRLNDTKDEIITLFGALEKSGVTPEGISSQEIEVEVKELTKKAMSVEGMTENSDDEEQIDPSEAVMNSAQTILYYSGIEKEKAEAFMEMLDQFECSKDRMSTDDEMRKLKKKIAPLVFEIYEKCVLKWMNNKDGADLPIKLFLYFGFFDERLLTFEQLKNLISALQKVGSFDEKGGIYYMPEWLEMIYKGLREPSRNAFEQDYPDYLREQKKQGEINEEEMNALMNDNKARLHFEVANMFTQVDKVVNGQIMTYIPILYQEEIFGNLPKLFMGRKTLRDMLLKIEAVDISAYVREITYRNELLEIEKEQIVTKVYPDIIVAPIYGSSASMWQEIGGKRRSTPARIVFPAFEESDAQKLMIQMVGRLHWEYVRREMGADWNNIQFKSLTSEYSDYFQYYRKNRELSEELRAKVKTQLQKSRNNFRDAFVMDYVNWMEFEANGAMKLNRVARNIMATYIPFNKELREEMKVNAIFEKAMHRQEKQFNEKVHSWGMKIKKRENHGDEVPQEFYDTYEYYSNS